MRETCAIKECGKAGKLGHGIMYIKVIENGKCISLPLCSKCEAELKTGRPTWKR